MFCLLSVFVLFLLTHNWIRTNKGGGAKFSWAQGRKIPKYGPAYSASYFNFQYRFFSVRSPSSLLLLLPRLLVIYISPSIFPSMTCLRVWSIYLAPFLLFVGYSSPPPIPAIHFNSHTIDPTDLLHGINPPDLILYAFFKIRGMLCW